MAAAPPGTARWRREDMSLFGSHKTRMVTAERGAARAVRPRCRFRSGTRSSADRWHRPTPRAREVAEFALGCFWGAEKNSGRCRAWYHGRRLRGRLHAEPDLRGGLLGSYRPCRGRAGGVRSGQGLLRATCSRCSGSRTTPPRACARATTSAPSTGRLSSTSPGAAGCRRARHGTPTRRS